MWQRAAGRRSLPPIPGEAPFGRTSMGGTGPCSVPTREPLSQLPKLLSVSFLGHGAGSLSPKGCTRGKTTDGVKPFCRSATTCSSSVPLAVSVLSSLCQSWGMLLALCLQFCTRGQSMADYISLPAPGAMLSGQRSSRRKGPQNWDSWSAAGQTGL